MDEMVSPKTTESKSTFDLHRSNKFSSCLNSSMNISLPNVNSILDIEFPIAPLVTDALAISFSTWIFISSAGVVSLMNFIVNIYLFLKG